MTSSQVTKQKRRKNKSPRRGHTTRHLPIDEILRRLDPLYGPPAPPRPYDPISELIFTVLSQHTSDVNSYRAFASLRSRFPSWEEVMEADVDLLARIIQMGGLAKVKAPRIQDILRTIRERNGSWDLSFLAEIPIEEAKKWLLDLPGVGPKTAGCVLLFSLGRPAMVVDTHVHRVAKRLNLVGKKVSADDAHHILEAKIPPEDILSAHIYLIAHGRKTCKAQNPLCPECILENGCPSSYLKQGELRKSKTA